MKTFNGIKSSGAILPAMRISSCIVVLVILSGRAAQSFSRDLPAATPPPAAYRTPTNLASRLVGADRIVATNWLEASHGGQGFGLSIEGSQVAKIVRAVSEARSNYDGTTPSLWDWELQFYRGTNRLDVIHFQGSAFLSECEYHDESGTLEEVYNKLLLIPEAAEQNRYGDQWFAATNKAEARHWLKEPSHAVFKGNKEKVVRFVEDFYIAGASEVFVGGIQIPGEGQDPVADHLIVVMPHDSTSRAKVFPVAKRAFNEWWNDFGYDVDIGQKYLFYSFKNGPRPR